MSKRVDSFPVEWQFSEETGELFASLSSSAEHAGLDTVVLRRSMQQAGYDALLLREGALEQLLGQAGAAPARVLIAQRKDAQVHIQVSDDAMRALVTTTPSFGGRELSEQLLREAADAQGVNWDLCDPKIIAEVLARKAVTDLVLARAIPMEAGRDGRFVPLVEGVRDVPLTEDAVGRVDFREVLDFIAVQPGTPLMRLEPPTPGKNGADVYGRAIPAQPGKALSFPTTVPGACIDPEDSCLLMAAIAGHPLVMDDRVQVDDVLTLDAVDVATGNVDFDGSVLIKGDVRAGSTVQASGDVVVEGIVDRATITAGNNITISGGVFGERVCAGEVCAPSARLAAGGDISANFMSATSVSAGKLVLVREYAAHCDVRGKRGIHLGQDGGKGRVIGGRCQSDRELLANVLGTDANVPTEIVVGCRPKLRSRHDALRQELEALLRRDEDITQVSRRLVRARRRIEALNGARIVIKQRIYPNTLLKINTRTLKISTAITTGKCYTCRAGAIETSAL